MVPSVRSATAVFVVASLLLVQHANAFATPRHWQCAHTVTPTTTTALQASTIPLMPERLQRKNPIRSTKNAVKKLAKSLQNNEVSRWRAAAVSCLASLFLFRRAIDTQLANLWTFLMTSQSVWGRIFRSDHFEWMIAVGAFMVYIHGYWFADRAVRKASEQGRVHKWRKYRLQDRYEADKHRRRRRARDQPHSVVATANEDEAPLVTKQSPWNKGGWLVEFWVYVLPLLVWDIVAPRRYRRLAPFGAPTTLQMLGGIAGGLFLYDLMFFVGHVLMHKIPFLYRRVHAKHHTLKEVRAGEIVRLGIPEEVIEVGYSIIAINALSVHPFARWIYNLVIVFLLTELHCGFDFPWSPQNVVPFGLVTGSRRHHYHHRHGKHYYQKFFFHVDRLFGFFQKNDGSVDGDSVQPNPYVPPSWS